jgi:uncharacterized protein YggU (UPF0235/DUF167 family)
MRITVWVKTGSARPGVGGEHDGALIVRVSARAVDGKATEAALTAVADSFGVRRSAVRLVSGASSRTKIVDIDAGDPRLLASLLATPGRLRPRRDVAAVRPSMLASAPVGRVAPKDIAGTSGEAARIDAARRRYCAAVSEAPITSARSSVDSTFLRRAGNPVLRLRGRPTACACWR